MEKQMNCDPEIKVKIEYSLPTHRLEFDMAMAAERYYRVLNDIYNACRQVWKYEDESDKTRFAEKIGEMVGEARLDDVE